MDSSDEWGVCDRLSKIIIFLFTNILSLQLIEFMLSEIKQKLCLAQKITRITAIDNTKIASAFSLFGVLCSPSQFAVPNK